MRPDTTRGSAPISRTLITRSAPTKQTAVHRHGAPKHYLVSHDSLWDTAVAFI